MSEGEWFFYNNRGDSIAFAFGNGWLHLSVEGTKMVVASDVIFDKRGKIGYYLRSIIHSPKHPTLFNRWFIQKLEEIPQWRELVKCWKEEDIQEKQNQLKLKRWQEESKDRPLSERELAIAERLTKLRLAFPAKRAVALEELTPHVQNLKEILKFLEAYRYKYFVTSDQVITELGMVGRCINTDIAIGELSTGLDLLERVIKSLTTTREPEVPR